MVFTSVWLQLLSLRSFPILTEMGIKHLDLIPKISAQGGMMGS